MSERVQLKAPFPYFGGKRAVAELVWRWLGDVRNYIEPFFGTGAVLLLRPHEPKIETVNDLDCMIANFWRAMQQAPDDVAEHANWPVNEADLHARHRWLVFSDDAAEFRRRMKTEPDYCAAKIAGWWVWGICQWIGAGWCSPQGRRRDGDVKQQQPNTMGDLAGGGVHRKLSEKIPNIDSRGVLSGRPQLADEYSRGRGVHGNDSAEACEQRRLWLIDWFRQLQDRLRTVRVCCGDWQRVCGSGSVTTRLGLTGVFLDPPYSAEADRAAGLYAAEDLSVAHDVRAWCLEHGGDRQMRIALCGLAGEHDELEQHGWQVEAWKSHGGYGNRNEDNTNRERERIWFSPHCVTEETLFSQNIERET